MTCFIIATNVSESSLTSTFPDVDIVIDTGLEKLLSYGHRMRLSVLEYAWCTCAESSKDQRRGRTGRVAAGV